jgi:F-type H+-transporting ATPase subunit epsilon
MRLDIITPEKTLYSSEKAISVICPGIDGDFQLLDSHASLVSALRSGKLLVSDDQNKSIELPIASGLVECNRNQVNILVEEAI